PPPPCSSAAPYTPLFRAEAQLDRSVAEQLGRIGQRAEAKSGLARAAQEYAAAARVGGPPSDLANAASAWEALYALDPTDRAAHRSEEPTSGRPPPAALVC